MGTDLFGVATSRAAVNASASGTTCTVTIRPSDSSILGTSMFGVATTRTAVAVTTRTAVAATSTTVSAGPDDLCFPVTCDDNASERPLLTLSVQNKCALVKSQYPSERGCV